MQLLVAESPDKWRLLSQVLMRYVGLQKQLCEEKLFFDSSNVLILGSVILLIVASCVTFNLPEIFWFAFKSST